MMIRCILCCVVIVITSCSESKVSTQEQAQDRLEGVMKKAEQKVNVMGVTSSGLNPRASNFSNSKLIKGLAEASYQARAAYLSSELCITEISSSDQSVDKQKLSYFHALKDKVKSIDSITNSRTEDPTVKVVMIEIEQLLAITKELEGLCK